MIQLKAINAVILDMDGTIFDMERLGVDKWIQAFGALGIPAPVKALHNKIGLSGKDSRRLMLEESVVDFDYDTVKKLKQRLTKEHIARFGTPIKEGFAELMEFLKNHSIKTAIATSRSRENTMYYLQHAGINAENQFDAIITGDMIEKGKPHPDIFLLASRLLDDSPDHCLVVEDSINGIMAAASAEIRAVMIPDLVEPDEELKKALYAMKDNLLGVIDVVCIANGY